MTVKKVSKIDDDDDEDIPARGRPRDPEEFGPPRPELHQREAYVRRLQSILGALEIPGLGREGRMFLERILSRADRLRELDSRRFKARGEDQVIMILRSIVETTSGIAALKLPIMSAVSLCLHDAWTNLGLGFLDAVDQVPLLKIDATLGLDEHLDKAIRFKLTQILGAPFAPPARKPAARKLVVKPSAVSKSAWSEVLEMQKADRRRAHERRQRMAA
jgi:hypothetical protein